MCSFALDPPEAKRTILEFKAHHIRRGRMEVCTRRSPNAIHAMRQIAFEQPAKRANLITRSFIFRWPNPGFWLALRDDATDNLLASWNIAQPITIDAIFVPFPRPSSRAA